MTNKKMIITGVAIVLGLGALNHALLPERTVSSRGICITNVVKDKFAITLQISNVAPNAAQSLRSVQDAASEIARGIAALNDNTVEMQTRNINSFEKTEWRNNSAINVGIQSQIDLEVTTNNRETIDAIINQTQNVRGVQVFPRNMRNFSSKPIIDAATAACLEYAIKDARAKASAMASGDNARVGRLVSAEYETTRGSIMPRPWGGVQMRLAASPMMEAGGDFMQSADDEISVQVSATFRLR